jgi:hypothetical protein
MTVSAVHAAVRWAALGCVGWLAAACGAQDDVVFQTFALELDSAPVVVREGAGVVEIPIRMTHASSSPISATYSIVKLEAQNDCQLPDFTAASGIAAWAPGATETRVEVYIGDDQLAETDEPFQILLDNVTGAVAPNPLGVVVAIQDDDRTGIVDARTEFGVEPGRADDQAAALQTALNRAGSMGRGVVLMAPGEYQISRVSLVPGTTLSARGVRWHRPPMSPSDTITLRASYTGAVDSPPTLVEGLFIDGHRDEQGPYQDEEQQEAHLTRWEATPDQPGRLRVTLEDLGTRAATASSVYVGPGADVDVCRLSASDVWRDALTLRGGGSALRLRYLDATASVGTTGIWLGGLDPGYQGTHAIDVEVEDARFGTGDVEIDAATGSTVTVRRLSMTQAPFRLRAPDSPVRISDSILVVGVPSDRHNYWAVPHDVEITGTTLIASEQGDDGQEAPEADRTLVAAAVRWGFGSTDPPFPGTHRLLFDRCRFERAQDVDPTDVVYAVANPTVGGTVLVRSSSLGAGVGGWFAPGCKDCQMEP